MVNLNLPVPGVTKGIGEAPPGEDWGTLHNIALLDLNAGLANVDEAPPGTTITIFGDVPRPTSRTDITVQWIHTTRPAAMNLAADIWLNI